MVGSLLIPSVLLALFIATIFGCTTLDAPESSAGDAIEESGSSDQFDDSLTGVWKGVSACRLSRWGANCHGIRNIAFTILRPSPSRIKGVYSCTTGTISLSQLAANWLDCANRRQRTEALAAGDAEGRLKLSLH
jgi:hypothetical protein